MSKKIFFFDLDGTLLNSQHNLDPETYQALKTLLADGHHVAITTGRAYEGIMPIFHHTPIYAELHYAVHNGAVIFHRDQPERIKAIDTRQLDDFVQKCHQSNIHFHYQTDQKTFINHPDERWQWLYELHRLDAQIIDHYREITDPILKICLMADDRPLTDFLEQSINDPFVQEHRLIRSAVFFADLTSAEADKQQAAAYLAEKMNISPEDTVAFGDHHNDIALLDWAGTGIAMGNAVTATKNAANTVTKSNDALGVVKALKKMGHIA